MGSSASIVNLVPEVIDNETFIKLCAQITFSDIAKISNSSNEATTIDRTTFGNNLIEIIKKTIVSNEDEEKKHIDTNTNSEFKINSDRLEEMENYRDMKLKVIQFLQKGFSVEELKSSGWFTLDQLIEGKCGMKDLLKVGYSLEELIKAGLDTELFAKEDWKDLMDLGYSPEELKKIGCKAIVLRELGIKERILKKIGYTIKDIYSAKEMKNNGSSLEQLLEFGYCSDEIKKAGYSKVEMIACKEFPLAEVFEAKELKEDGFSVEELKSAGRFTVKHLVEAKYETIDLLKVGYSLEELIKAGLDTELFAKEDWKDLMDLGYSPEELKKIGCKAIVLRELGIKERILKKIGYTIKDIYSAKEMKNNGTSLEQLLEFGYCSDEIKKAGYSKVEMIACKEFPLAEVFEAKELKNDGWTIQNLLERKFRPYNIEGAGFTIDELKECITFPLNRLFDVDELKKEGWTVQQLLDRYFDYYDIKDSFSKEELSAVKGFPLYHIYTAKQQKEKGFTIRQLIDNGYGFTEIVRAGFPKEEVIKEGTITMTWKEAKYKVYKEMKENKYHHSTRYNHGMWRCCRSVDLFARGCQEGEQKHHPFRYFADNHNYLCESCYNPFNTKGCKDGLESAEFITYPSCYNYFLQEAYTEEIYKLLLIHWKEKHHPVGYKNGFYGCCEKTDILSEGCQLGDIRHHPMRWDNDSCYSCCNNNNKLSIGCEPGFGKMFYNWNNDEFLLSPPDMFSFSNNEMYYEDFILKLSMQPINDDSNDKTNNQK